MTDQATAVARALVENEIAFDDLSEIPAALRQRFPGITQSEIAHGIRIAVEVVLMDGPKADRTDG